MGIQPTILPSIFFCMSRLFCCSSLFFVSLWGATLSLDVRIFLSLSFPVQLSSYLSHHLRTKIFRLLQVKPSAPVGERFIYLNVSTSFRKTLRKKKLNSAVQFPDEIDMSVHLDEKPGSVSLLSLTSLYLIR